MAKYQQLSEKALSRAMAMFGVVFWLVALVWHGLLGNPSMMSYMYPSFTYLNPLNSVTLLVVLVVGFFIAGWLVAAFYNWNLKRK